MMNTWMLRTLNFRKAPRRPTQHAQSFTSASFDQTGVRFKDCSMVCAMAPTHRTLKDPPNNKLFSRAPSSSVISYVCNIYIYIYMVPPKKIKNRHPHSWFIEIYNKSCICWAPVFLEITPAQTQIARQNPTTC